MSLLMPHSGGSVSVVAPQVLKVRAPSVIGALLRQESVGVPLALKRKWNAKLPPLGPP